MKKCLVLVMVLALAMPLAACGGSGTETTSSGADLSQSTQEGAPASAAATAAQPTEEIAVGSRDNPVPIGVPLQVGDWEVSVVDVNPNAAEAVAAENQFNDPPAEGNSFVMIGLKGTYTGKDSGSFFGDMSYKVLGPGGNTYSDTCGVIPDDITDTGETFTGATVEGNLCFSVPTDDLAGAQLILDEAFSFSSGGRKFFALQ